MSGNVIKCFASMAFIVMAVHMSAQSNKDSISYKSSDRYLEDQFYAGLGYNFLLDKPTDVILRNLSYNLQVGFIKDIPINTRRNFGFGLGLGYAANSYYNNIVANEVDGLIAYSIASTADFERSKFETHAIEMPIELRWRTSTIDEYKFWRIYAGVKLGYVFSGRSKLVAEDGSNGFSNGDIQNFQYGLVMNFGYNTWNIHAHYSLNPLLNDDISLENGDPIDARVFRIGVIFYIL